MGASGSQSSSNNNSQSEQNAFGTAFNQGTSTGGTFIDPTQAPFRSSLFDQAFRFGDAGGAAGDAGRAGAENQTALTGALNAASAQTNAEAQIAAQSKALQSGLAAMCRDDINPALKGHAIMAGGFGGGRQGVAQGVAAGKLGEAFTQGLGDITARANSQSLQAANLIPSLAQANLVNTQAPQNAGLSILERLGGILGNPAILAKNQSQSTGGSVNTSTGKSASSGSSKQQSFGFNWGPI
jgi:hypothetical protein